MHAVFYCYPLSMLDQMWTNVRMHACMQSMCCTQHRSTANSVIAVQCTFHAGSAAHQFFLGVLPNCACRNSQTCPAALLSGSLALCCCNCLRGRLWCPCALLPSSPRSVSVLQVGRVSVCLTTLPHVVVYSSSLCNLCCSKPTLHNRAHSITQCSPRSPYALLLVAANELHGCRTLCLHAIACSCHVCAPLWRPPQPTHRMRCCAAPHPVLPASSHALLPVLAILCTCIAACRVTKSPTSACCPAALPPLHSGHVCAPLWRAPQPRH